MSSDRKKARDAFLAQAGWADAAATPVAGDASTRLYERLVKDGQSAILMDAPPGPDGPPVRDGKSYSAIVHLAENMRPFAAIARHLRSQGFSAPEIFAQDLAQGFLLLEDLGDGVFAARIEAGDSEEELYGGAVDVLAAMHGHAAPHALPCGDDGPAHVVPAYDDMALYTETELLPSWYARLAFGSDLDEAAQEAFKAAWMQVFPKARAAADVLLLRDYHSPNLLVLDSRMGLERIGIIDFQDGLTGPAAYDVASLLQDARRTVAVDIEARLLTRYEAARSAQGQDFDADAFRAAYAIMGAQRNTKIIGIFARLLLRDGKPGYLQHIPRLADYLARDLTHPALAPVADWFASHLPLEKIRMPIDPDSVKHSVT
ncbi:MAG: aminoglycoside phosphotransferase family protein [Candidatus Phaeomarinobacter sp.]